MRKLRSGRKDGLTIVSSHLLRMTAADWNSPELRFEKLRGEALGQLVAAASNANGGSKATRRRALILFDCLLRAIGEPPITSALSFQTDRFRELQLFFYGALGSTGFLEAAEVTRIGYAYGFYTLLKGLKERTPITLADYHQGAATEIPIELIEKFEDQDFVTDEVMKLRPFLLHSKNGLEYRVLLTGLVSPLGSRFTDAFHHGLQHIAATKKKDANLRDFGTTFTKFVANLASEDRPISAALLKDPSFVDVLLIDFMEYHFMKLTRRKASAGEGTLPSLQKQWSRYKLYWTALAEQGIVASPQHAFPEGNPALLAKQEVGHRRISTNQNGTSSLVTTKLIVPVPIHLTDEEASLLLFEKLREQFETVQSWLRQHLLDFFADAAIGERLAASVSTLQLDSELKGVIARDSKSERAMALAVKCFKELHGGYIDTSCETNAVYPKGASRGSVSKTRLSRYLGIPRRQEAMALMGYLASVDGRFSESALSACQIFDSGGLRINVVEVDSGLGISVLKERHSGNGWHDIVLTDEAAEMVRRWVAHTEPLRNHMRENGIRGWQNLFIYSGAAIGAPKHFDRSSNLHSFFRDFARANAERLGDVSEHVSIAKIRSTRGVLRFLETMDIQKMAFELGNTADTSLRHYLPEALWEYFATRWLRIFQNLQIVEATRDTPYMQRALGFKSAVEMDQFLRNHALRPLHPKSVRGPASAPREPETGRREVLVSASPDIFVALLSIAEAARRAKIAGHKVSGHGLYWMEFAEKIREHIQSEQYHDVAIKAMLQRAASNILPEKFMEAVRA
ncbi:MULTISPECIES: hypothetical protein [Ralstonia solanacearum species complex]|uniref:hypothetical protein n=1 Tax=Ralstonia solanacearum species complex TaxID=3116862 RepID=UPI0010728C87|nr:hypothetical protein [Ralstonia solanacearum]